MFQPRGRANTMALRGKHAWHIRARIRAIRADEQGKSSRQKGSEKL